MSTIFSFRNEKGAKNQQVLTCSSLLSECAKKGDDSLNEKSLVGEYSISWIDALLVYCREQ